MTRPRPLIVGVLSVPARSALEKLRDGRLRIAIYARDEGYSVLEIYEVIGNGDSVYNRLSTVMDHSEATAILICGAQVDRHRVGAIAASAGMRVLELPAERPIFPQPDRLPPKRRGPP